MYRATEVQHNHELRTDECEEWKEPWAVLSSTLPLVPALTEGLT